MIYSTSTAPVANSERFERIGTAADAVTAARTRDEFAQWLGTFFDLDPSRTNDLVLAVNEALANSAEHAYRPAGLAGTTDVQASHAGRESVLTVTVSDQGAWRLAGLVPGNRSRGRGIPIMTALSDHADIATSIHGTVVSLAWNGVHRR